MKLAVGKLASRGYRPGPSRVMLPVPFGRRVPSPVARSQDKHYDTHYLDAKGHAESKNQAQGMP